MAIRSRLLATIGLAAAAVAVWSSSLWAQPGSSQPASGPASPQPAGPAEAKPADKLALEEQRIADKYRHLEDVLLRIAELGAASDPRRAALLRKAVAQSKEQLIAVRLEQLVELLGKDQLFRALETQTEVDQDLRALLELLMSENRAKRVESEKTRIREYLKRINGIIKQQKDLQGRTAGGDEPKRLAGEQGKVADKTRDLANDVRKNEQKGERGKGKAEKEAGTKEGGGGSAPAKQPDQSQDPAPERLEAAQQRMKEAEAKLGAAQRQGASEKQEEAIRQLQLAKAKLEQILRQLREEEIARTLAMLEARFRKMLEMQEEVLTGTVRLDGVPAAGRTHSHEIEASRLSGRESQILVELDKALLLLRDDGSAVAFLEAARQIRDDVQQLVERLAQAKVGKITQNVEEEVMTALKEMIEALKKAQKDQSSKKRPPGQPAPGQPQEPPLVDALAELKMIRALQMRVNTRTARYAKMIEGEQAENAELVEALRRLAEHQQRIHRITYDLQMGKNR
jgi:hypothetical protein